MTDAEMARRFSVMYEENRARVYAFAVSKAGRQLADEIMSETFMIAWRRFDVVPDPPLPWLLAVARNVAMRQFRALTRQQSLAAEMSAWVSAEQPTVGDIAEDVADRIAVLTALATLTESDRELLTLVAWHDLAPTSAARVIGCSTAAYFVRLHRARRRFEVAVAAASADRMPSAPVVQAHVVQAHVVQAQVVQAQVVQASTPRGSSTARQERVQ